MDLGHGLLHISQPALEFVDRRAVQLVLGNVADVWCINLGYNIDVGSGFGVLGGWRIVGDDRRRRIGGLVVGGNVFGFHGVAEPIGGPPGSQRRVRARSDRPHTAPIVTLTEVRPILLLLGLMLLGCASDAADNGAAAQETTSSTAALAPPTTTVPVTASTTTSATSTTIATSTTLPATTTTIGTEPTCVTLTDFSESNEAWRAVNDGVMGGRSEGGPSFTDGSMTFAGEINTNGGGYSSVRALLAPGTLAGATAIRVVGVPDDRTYRLILSDAADGRDRRVSHQADLVFESADETEGVATVSLDSLETSIFGQLVFTEPFEPDLAVELGIQIADGIDGPFELTVGRIDRCSG